MDRSMSAFCISGSVYCNLDDDLMHRFTVSSGDAGRVRILREENHEAATAYGQLYGLTLVEVYITIGAGFDLFFHGAQRCDADELFAVNEVRRSIYFLCASGLSFTGLVS